MNSKPTSQRKFIFFKKTTRFLKTFKIGELLDGRELINSLKNGNVEGIHRH